MSTSMFNCPSTGWVELLVNGSWIRAIEVTGKKKAAKDGTPKPRTWRAFNATKHDPKEITIGGPNGATKWRYPQTGYSVENY